VTIIRAPRPERNFTIISNAIVRDQKLTYRARGILAYLLSQPDHWRTNADRMQYPSTEGRDAIRSALNELEKAGYVVFVKRQTAKGTWLSEWLVYDEPVHNRTVDDLWTSKENGDQPSPEKPTPDNQAIYKELINKMDAKKSERLLKTQLPSLCKTCAGSGRNVTTTIKGYQIGICSSCKGEAIR
jgi:hypothetical protein